jgi:saccharopine dehydrogenase-like NADP-dependent oxidoreductase
MKKILVLGAGMVSRPLVRYLLNQPDYSVKMASRTVSKAKKIIGTHEKGEAISLDVTNDASLEKLVSESDITVSLLPYTYHVKVAKLCIEHNIPLVTTSYVSDAMKDLNESAKEAGVLVLNECGLDPGIDHMSAMKVIHTVKTNGGKIISFRSTTGALPSHEANTNPFGYKFSWSPKGVLLASRNAARWLENGKEVSIPGERLFEHYTIQDVPGAGSFENYPNRDSIPYKTIYGLEDAHTVYRGTFRMTGWCETLRNVVALGWLNDNPVSDFSGSTYADLTRKFIGASPRDDLIKTTSHYLGLPIYSAVIKRFEWLGLFSEEILPPDRNTPLDYFNMLTLRKMALQEKERDMIIMHHEFIVEYPQKKEYITSTLLDYGIPNGDSSVARTVAFPAAIAVKMILENKIELNGIYIPVIPEIYNPILNELEGMNICFSEQIMPY